MATCGISSALQLHPICVMRGPGALVASGPRAMAPIYTQAHVWPVCRAVRERHAIFMILVRTYTGIASVCRMRATFKCVRDTTRDASTPRHAPLI